MKTTMRILETRRKIMMTQQSALLKEKELEILASPEDHLESHQREELIMPHQITGLISRDWILPISL